MQRSGRIAIVTLAALALAWVAAWLISSQLAERQGGPAATAERHSGTAAIGGSFELVDHTGKTVTDESFRGQYLLIFFGYSYCPDICPLELEKLSRALDRIEQAAPSVLDHLRPLFITIDPERDTPERLAEYVDFFHPAIVGLSGSAKQIEQAAGAYRVYYRKAGDKQSDDGYLMDHSSVIYLMSPQNTYVRHFTLDDDAATIAEAVRDTVAGDIS